MKIRKAISKDKKEALAIARNLQEWFNEEGLKNMKTDFKLNNVVVAMNKNKVVGFLCYTSYCGKMLLMWMGVKKDFQRKSIGERLLKWLEKEAKKLKLYLIEVETLSDKYNYQLYKVTRAFYYKHGFKRVAYMKARIKGWDDQIILEKRVR